MDPKLAKDFPIDWEEDQYVSRREFFKFMTLASGGLAVGSVGLAAWTKLKRDERSFEPALIAKIGDVPVGGSMGFSYPRPHDICILIQPEEGEYVAEWHADEHHQAFPGMLSGGIIGSLLDCHSNWTAAHYLMKKSGKSAPDCTVTANYAVKLLRPTPYDVPIFLKARVVESTDTTATVEAELIANEKVCATCRGLFVIVKEGHPAYHRW